MNPIYLDHAATTPLHPIVLEAMMPFLTGRFGNPSSVHSFGRSARSAVDEARRSIAARLGCSDKDLIFTAGGTESDNLALFGAAGLSGGKTHIITTRIEHQAVLNACQDLEDRGFTITYLPVDIHGRIHIEDVEQAIRPDTLMASVMFGNNEVGTLQPIREIGGLFRDKGIIFHVDAVQALGVEEIDCRDLPVDLMSLAAHKAGGPKGIGLLYCAPHIRLSPRLLGGSQERGRRAGTEYTAGIVGFAKAVEIAAADLPAARSRLNRLRSVMTEELASRIGSKAFTVNGHPQFCLPHILNLSFPGISTETMLMNLDIEGIAASGGSACTAGSLQPSHVLQAMGVPEEVISSAVRFSFGTETAEKIATIYRRIRKE
jgi:cysteine desulfurase